GYVAKRMGVPIDRLVIATNQNDILVRTMETGRYETSAVEASTSPSMDIQVSSNFERLLFDAGGRDAESIRGAMASLSQSGAFALEDGTLTAIRDEFDAGRADEGVVAQTINDVLKKSDYLLDTHTALGVAVARDFPSQSPMVVLGTAHPAKFPDAVEAASGVRPPLPERSRDLMKGEERFTILPNDQRAVEDFIAKHSRAAK
ncbi:MAG: threonine synthase, partial [Pseudomonadota bacterium]